MNIQPAKEAEHRIKSAGVCPQCLGRGVYRTLEKRGKQVVTILVDCTACATREAKQ